MTHHGKKNRAHPGNVILGRSRATDSPNPAYKILFRCRKNGMDYLGQARVDSSPPGLEFELFNENYFGQFPEGEGAARTALENEILKRLLEANRLSSALADSIRFLRDEKVREEGAEDLTAERVATAPPDLQTLFDRLNREYFNGGIQASICWGRDRRGNYRRSIRFGSYDLEKKLIRIHPRLRRGFIPSFVVEMTVYHEMCHQLFPPVRRGGRSVAHHAQFKRKEREYKFFGEVRRWEKENWKKLLSGEDGPGGR